MQSKPRKATIRLHHPREKLPLTIVGDAAAATRGVGEGRFIPLLIVDAALRPDLLELIRVQEHIKLGEVQTAWGKGCARNSNVSLILEFLKPIELTALIEFEIPGQACLVDLVMQARAFYLQLGHSGDRFSTPPDSKRLRIEVSDVGFRQAWDNIYHKVVIQQLRNEGMNRLDAKRACAEVLKEWRRLGQLRPWG